MRQKGKDWTVWRLRQDKGVRPKASTGLSLLRFLRLTCHGGEDSGVVFFECFHGVSQGSPHRIPPELHATSQLPS